MSIEETVLARIMPNSEDESAMKAACDGLIKRISTDEEVRGLGARPRLVGSVAKGTHHRHPDLDVFLVFPSDADFETMVPLCERLGQECLEDMERRFADHPYIHGRFAGFEVDLVPCYRMEIGEEVRSAVDRTPLHTDHIIRNIQPCQRDEARLLKAFMKGVGIYGADSRARGFSGYLAELLILHHGGFLDVLRAASTWKEGHRLLIGDIPPESEAALMVQDPVDPSRNVASAVHIDSLALFIHASHRYLDNPDTRFFFPRERRVLEVQEARELLDSRGTRLLSVMISVEGISEDNLHSQAHKALGGILALLRKRGFEVLRSRYVLNGDVHFIFELVTDTLPAAELHNGPPVWVSNSIDFLEKWKHSPFGPPYIKDGRWRTFRLRSERTAEGLLRKELKGVSLGAGLSKNDAVVLGHEETLAERSMPVVTTLLDTRMSWDV